MALRSCGSGRPLGILPLLLRDGGSLRGARDADNPVPKTWKLVAPADLSGAAVEPVELPPGRRDDIAALQRHVDEVGAFQLGAPDCFAGVAIDREDGALDADHDRARTSHKISSELTTAAVSRSSHAGNGDGCGAEGLR